MMFILLVLLFTKFDFQIQIGFMLKMKCRKIMNYVLYLAMSYGCGTLGMLLIQLGSQLDMWCVLVSFSLHNCMLKWLSVKACLSC